MDSFQTCYDRDRHLSLSCAVVEAVADASATDPADLGPLYEVVDPDALDSLFDRRTGEDDTSGPGSVTFVYEGYRVRVSGTGDIELDRVGGEGQARIAADGTGRVADAETFRAELARLLRSAAANGVDVEGGWSTRDGLDPDLGVEIYPVEHQRR